MDNKTKFPLVTHYAFFLLALLAFFYTYCFHEWTLLSQCLCMIFCFFLLYLKNKKIIFNSAFLCCAFLIYYKHVVIGYNQIQIIQNAREFTGIIIDKKKSKKNFLYLLKVKSILTGTIFKKSSLVIKLISKKDLCLMDYVICKNIFHINKIQNIENCKKQKFYGGYSGICISNTIRKCNSSFYKNLYSPSTFLFNYKEKIMEQIRVALPTEHLFNTILLGETSTEEQTRKIFNTWGIAHYLARSGLHIQIIISILSSFLLFLGISYVRNIYIQTFILIFFYFLSYESISFLRSLLMFILGKTCILLKIKTTTLHIISITTLLILIVNPFYFLLLSTQLSFLCTFILCLIN